MKLGIGLRAGPDTGINLRLESKLLPTRAVTGREVGLEKASRDASPSKSHDKDFRIAAAYYLLIHCSVWCKL